MSDDVAQRDMVALEALMILQVDDNDSHSIQQLDVALESLDIALEPMGIPLDIGDVISYNFDQLGVQILDNDSSSSKQLPVNETIVCNNPFEPHFCIVCGIKLKSKEDEHSCDEEEDEY